MSKTKAVTEFTKSLDAMSEQFHALETERDNLLDQLNGAEDIVEVLARIDANDPADIVYGAEIRDALKTWERALDD